ncbi:hypothetical protein [Shewanella xiamenensis]|jgi:hypothetical protein|uniref:hypothetical protein n=1 Tax=Shewanella xiamenensis TaxID=332186 RepID=UPI00217E62FC|nr:hypothetical protein [Shewanella xiamenensis]MCT8871598.1 hypothetical protein [Shewanella xiamenensis]UWH43565.1 hypothetical protein KXJ80_10160 [Shewanella xiamenensis]
MTLDIGEAYQFKGVRDQIIYVGKEGNWHQFELNGEPGVIWCELLDTDLHLIEKAGA